MNKNIGSQIIHLDNIDSTNNYANLLIQTKRQLHGVAIFAKYQTAGKGQKGNFWESKYGENLTFSLILKPQGVPIPRQFRISQAVSLGICDYLQEHTDRKVNIKWPNDIYVENNKICGILIETKWMGEYIKDAIIGIGLNINQEHFESDAPNPISLFNITNKKYVLEEEEKNLLETIERRWEQMEQEPEHTNSDYHDMLYLKDLLANFEDSEGTFSGMIMGVNEIGQLHIKKKDTSDHFYNFKEVKLLSSLESQEG